MSDHIPFAIQVEIIKRVPIKSLIRFRLVSKPWKSLIDSSEFIADYSIHHSQPQRLLVRYRDPADSELKYVLIDDDDDDTFAQCKCSLNVPLFVKSIENPEIIGSSQGLLCLYGYYQDGFDETVVVVVLWNPLIRKSVVIKMADELDSPYETVVGFGVCPHTNDPKLVKINCSSSSVNWESISSIPSQVEVFMLSSRAWRIPSTNLPRKSICFQFSHIVIDGFIYWISFDRTIVDDSKGYNLIVSFDLTSEEFQEIYLPEHLAQHSPETLSISKLRDSLVVLDPTENGENLVYGVWMMEHGVPNSFRKLFTIDVPNVSVYRPVGCRENGQPMLETIYKYAKSAALEVYEPSLKLLKDVKIYGKVGSFFVSSYKETLILLDQPDCGIYSQM